MSETQSVQIRAATPEDIEIIVTQRRAMFFDMGYRDEQALDAMTGSFRPWLRRKMLAGEYLAWLAIAPDGSAAAGVGLWLMDWPAVIWSAEGPRGNILNVYTRPENRHQGIARLLVNTAIGWCRDNRVRAVILHASAEGRGLYQSLGFKPTNEMRIVFD